MVFLQAATGASTGPAASCLRLAEQGKVKLLLSPLVLSEIRDVFSRPALRKKFKKLTDETAANILAQAVSCSETLPEPPKAFPLPRDPDDEPYLNLAIAGDAKYLVSWNERHLNYLMKADTPEGKDFSARFPSLKIVTPPVLLAALRSEAAAAARKKEEGGGTAP